MRSWVVLKLCKMFQNDYKSSCKISAGSYQEQATPYAKSFVGFVGLPLFISLFYS